MVARPALTAEIARPVQFLVDRLGEAESIEACHDWMVEAVLGYGWKVLYAYSIAVFLFVKESSVFIFQENIHAFHALPG